MSTHHPTTHVTGQIISFGDSPDPDCRILGMFEEFYRGEIIAIEPTPSSRPWDGSRYLIQVRRARCLMWACDHTTCCQHLPGSRVWLHEDDERLCATAPF